MARTFVYLIALAFQALAFTASAAEALLPEDRAFVFTATLESPDRIMARWDIAEGYYMYRDKMGFELSAQGTPVGAIDIPVFPRGKDKQDPIFGSVEVYTSRFELAIPLSGPAPQDLVITAYGQGCNEPIGVCYPPMSREVAFAATSASQAGSSELFQAAESLSPTPQEESDDLPELGTADELRALLSAGFGEQEFLDVDDAFRLDIELVDTHNLYAIFQIADGYYLYREKISISTPGGNHVAAAPLPPGKVKTDEYFGEVEVFEFDFVVPVTLDTEVEKVRLEVSYQGCAEDGICYSPVSKTFDLASLVVTDAVAAHTTGQADPDTELKPVDNADGQSGLPASAAVPVPGQDSEQGMAESDFKSLPGILLGAFIAGLFLTFTPCVLPMIPIISSIIAGQGEQLTRTRGGILATGYVAGTMVTYAAMGALAGATGDQLQAYFQNVWAIGALSGLFFVMALAMFGLFELQMPASIQSRIQSRTGGLGGSLPLVFILGLFSALIIGACVSPVLISFLGIAVSSGDSLLGAQIMLSMALGMGIPLILLGIGAGHFIPRAGQWMVKIRQGFGVMLVAVSIYLLGLLPDVPVLLLWGAFFIILSVFLGATQKSSRKMSPWQQFEKGVGTVLLVWGIILFLGGLLGERSILRPIPRTLFSQAVTPMGENAAERFHFTRVETVAELDQQLGSAMQQQKYVMIDYYADWCIECIRMEETTFSDSRIIAVLNEKFVSLQIDVTDPNDEEGKALKKRFDVFGPPATLFMDLDGNVLKNANFYGYMGNDQFLDLITRI